MNILVISENFRDHRRMTQLVEMDGKTRWVGKQMKSIENDTNYIHFVGAHRESIQGYNPDLIVCSSRVRDNFELMQEVKVRTFRNQAPIVYV